MSYFRGTSGYLSQRPARSDLFRQTARARIKNVQVYPLLNTKFINCKFIDDHPDFVHLKRQLDKFNQEMAMANSTKTKIDHDQIRVNFNILLRKRMLEIISTQNRQLQKTYLNKTKMWYESTNKKLEQTWNRDPQESNERLQTSHHNKKFPRYQSVITTRPVTCDPNFESELTLENKFQDQFSATGTQMGKLKSMKTDYDVYTRPSSQIESRMREYNLGSRTLHRQSDPPADRLFSYKRKIIFEPVDWKAKLKKKKEDEITQLYKDIKVDIQDRKPPHQLGRLDKDELEKKQIKVKIKKSKRKKKKKKKKAPAKPITIPAWMHRRQKLYEKTIEERFRQFADDKYRKMLQKVPYAYRSNYAKFKPKGTDIREHIIEQYWRNKRNRELAKKRAAEEDIIRIQRYASNKRCIIQEIGRRIESLAVTNNLKAREKQSCAGMHSYNRIFDKDGKRMTSIYNLNKSESDSLDESLLNWQQDTQVVKSPKVKETEQSTDDKKDDDEEGEVSDEINLDDYKVSTDAKSPIQKQRPATNLKMRTLTKEAERRTQSFDFRGFIPNVNLKYFPGKFRFKKEGIEKSIHKYKLEQIRALTKKITYPRSDDEEESEPPGEDEEPPQVLKVKPGLSIFTKGNKGVQYKPFSQSLFRAKDQFFRDSLGEIKKIKHHFNGRGLLRVPIRALQQAIVPPLICYQTNRNIPHPKRKVAKNPFDKPKKKKGKGKKGRRKKK